MTVMFLVNEQNMYVIYIDINVISLCLDLNIFSKISVCSIKTRPGIRTSAINSNLNTSISQYMDDLSLASLYQSTAEWGAK